ncbi:hypothetical protein C8R48DRAFT_672113 [Suillus tomentosus]|nr:hypothetical protein C8R48DRAFT_672113 [Suillus tomentosus]
MREEDWPPNSQIVYKQRRKLTGDILLAATDKQPEFDAVKSRLMKDAKYVQALALVPEGRISYLRLNVQKAAEAHIASHYGLTKGMDEKVVELLKNNVFIYLLNSKGKPTCSKLFQASAIPDTLADAFFSDDTGAGVKFHDSLTSILEDHPDEVELPVAMVALAGAAVCSIIMHYSSEKYDRDFNSDLYGGIYKTLVSTLNSIFKNSERKFHVLMHSLYMTVYGSKCSKVDPDTDTILMFLNIDAMAED